MYVRQLQVVDFRSWEHADLTFEPGPSVLVGANGQGKTNLVEAIGYTATLGSHRVATDAPMIRHGAARAVVRTAVVSEGRELTIELEITAGKANRARVNRGPVPRPGTSSGSSARSCSRRRISRWSVVIPVSAGGSSTTCSSCGHRGTPVSARTTSGC
ncbi:hypothetical protein GCM10029964_123270 [Kibdelosporangium lantanae]